MTRNRGLVRVLDEMLTHRYGNSLHKVLLPERWAGRTVGELHGTLKREQEATLISLEIGDDSDRQVLVNPPVIHLLKVGDAAVLLAPGPVDL